MAYLKPQAPLMSGEDYVYPLTTADQVVLSDGSRFEKNGVATAQDADKLGGKAPEYYIQPRNLLDNSDFTNLVNQRGVTDADFVWSYTCDRWLANGNGFLFSEDGVTIPASGQFAQRLPLEYGEKLGNLTFAVTLSTGEIFVTTGVTNTNVIELIIGYASSNTRFNVVIRNNSGAAITVKNCALYEGVYTADTLPPYVPKGYAAELAECQRYYIKIAHSSSVFDTCQLGFITDSAKKLVISVPIENMRITPTASLAGKIIIRGISGYVDSSGNGIDLAIERCTQRSIVFIRPDGNAFSLNATNNTPIQISLASGASIGFSADL